MLIVASVINKRDKGHRLLATPLVVLKATPKDVMKLRKKQDLRAFTPL